MRKLFPAYSVLLVSVVVLAGCGGNAQRTFTVPPGGRGSVPQFSHVVVVVEENHSYGQVIGNSVMPFLNRLATQNALATQYFADAHPSIPNYFMLTTGQPITFDDSFTGTVSADNIAAELVAAGKTWKYYGQSLPSAGYTGGDVYPYVKRHNPFAYFTNVIGTAQANNLVPFSQFGADLAANQLPDFSLVVPDVEHDAHDCPDGSQTCSDNDKLSAADAWLQQNIGPLLSNSNFQKNGLLVVVFDEGAQSDVSGGGGRVAMVMAGTGVKTGFQSTTTHEHAGLLRTVMEAVGVQQFPAGAAAAADLGEFF